MVCNTDIRTRFVAIIIVMTLLFAVPAMSVTSLEGSLGTPPSTLMISPSAHGTLVALADNGSHVMRGFAAGEVLHAENPLLAEGGPKTTRLPSPLRAPVAPRTSLSPLRI